MKLRDLLPRIDRPLAAGPLDVEVAAVTADSRRVEPGTAFVAVRGAQLDGLDFLPVALEKGAAVVVADRPAPEDHDEALPWVQVADPRAALSAIAAALCGDPSAELKLVGVTGTNGKTTVSYLCHHLMKTAWHHAGLLGTVVTDDGNEVRRSTHTTPDAADLQGLLATMRDAGCRGAALEVSSHGIDQRRVADVAFDVLVFTNLSQDHLDYHRSMEAYAAAKDSWFEQAAGEPRGKKPIAVVNLDDAHGAGLAERLRDRMRVVTFGFGLAADYRATGFRQSDKGSEIQLEARGKSFLLRTPLIGRFNVMNSLAALAGAAAAGVPLREAVAAMADSPQVPGRMELCASRDRVHVFVDYAHTPDALENACRTLRELEPRRLITVFGCGGDRDKGKRPLMAKAAARHSDACVLTSDNPRSEDPARILEEIEKGMGSARYRVVPDRAEAIRIAIHAAGRGDIVLIAGKGHEPYQEIAGERISFDDRVEARKAIDERPSNHRLKP